MFRHHPARREDHKVAMAVPGVSVGAVRTGRSTDRVVEADRADRVEAAEVVFIGRKACHATTSAANARVRRPGDTLERRLAATLALSSKAAGAEKSRLASPLARISPQFTGENSAP